MIKEESQLRDDWLTKPKLKNKARTAKGKDPSHDVVNKGPRIAGMRGSVVIYTEIT
jgi:hypothetical protein